MGQFSSLLLVICICALLCKIGNSFHIDDSDVENGDLHKVVIGLMEQFERMQKSNDELRRKFEKIEVDVLNLKRSNGKLKNENKKLREETEFCKSSIEQILRRNENAPNSSIHSVTLDDKSGRIEGDDESVPFKRLLAPVPTTIQQHDRVAFFSRVTGGLPHLGDNQVVPFGMEKVDTNNAFHQDTGIFEAPRDGLYAFFATITSYPAKMEFSIAKNGNEVAFGVSENGDAKWASASVSVLIALTAGDHVYVKIHGSGHGATSEMIGSYSHFMGFSL